MPELKSEDTNEHDEEHDDEGEDDDKEEEEHDQSDDETSDRDEEGGEPRQAWLCDGRAGKCSCSLQQQTTQTPGEFSEVRDAEVKTGREPRTGSLAELTFRSEPPDVADVRNGSGPRKLSLAELMFKSEPQLASRRSQTHRERAESEGAWSEGGARSEPSQRLVRRSLTVGKSVEMYLSRSCTNDRLPVMATPTQDSLLAMSEVTACQEITMWVLAVSDLKALGGFQVHEDTRTAGMLEDLEDLNDNDATAGEETSCCFVSHKWAGFDHPDPSGTKYQALCDLLESVTARPLLAAEQVQDAESDSARNLLTSGYAWMDVWSVPQQDFDQQAAYIDCIPRFVQRCSLFIVLAPACQHADTHETIDIDTWRGRGWCRLEVLANTFAKSPAPYLVIESDSHRLMPPTWEPMQAELVSCGVFSCCALNHVLSNGQQIRCDKERAAHMAESMVNASTQAAKDAGDLAALERMSARRERLESSLPGVRSPGSWP
jgi:hypothetical protein